MSYNHRKRKRSGKSCVNGHDLKILGLILFAFGAITLCAFLLPLKAWIVLLSLVLVICGVLLFTC